MTAAAYVALLHNAALLLALALVYDLVTSRFPTTGRPLRQAVFGLVVGTLGIGIMAAPLRLETGIVFDTRSVLLAVSGLFLGPLPTGVAVVVTAAFRLLLGGAGAFTGAYVLVVSAGIGLAARATWKEPLEEISVRRLYALGIVTHLAMLGLMLTLPDGAGPRVLRTIALPVLLLFPLATAALGLLMSSRLHRDRVVDRLQESEARYRSLFENDNVVMLLVDPRAATVVDGNPAACRTYGYSRDELRGMPCARISLLPLVDLLAELDRAQRKEQRTFLFQHRLADGSVRDVETFDSPIVVDGRPLLYSIVHDVTERKRSEEEARRLLRSLEESRSELMSVVEDQKAAEAEVRRLNADLEERVLERTAQLEAAMKELDAFSYSVSHDLRAPLRAVSGYARMLVEDYGDRLDAEGTRLLDAASGAAERMGRLIDDLLRLSRLGRQSLQKSPTDMTSLVREVVEEASPRAFGRSVDLRIEELPVAPADRNLLRQVWVNLFDNALKYTRRRDRTEITVSGSKDGDEAVYCIRDNGTGFDMKYATKLFGVFQRLHTPAEFEGTGVGLALVKRIVARHGGRVWAEAEPDKGAAFYFSLPVPQPSSGPISISSLRLPSAP